jgi:hypothetical protein
MSVFVSGAATMGLGVIAMFFLRYYRQSRDRLFLMFAIAFAILSANRILLGLAEPEGEIRPLLFAVRLSAFLIILIAIFDKNRAGRPR